MSTGYEPHKLLWHHPWSSVCLIHCTVLWISAGSSGVGLTKSQWDGRTPTDAKWLLNLPGCADRNPTSNQIVLKIHWQNARLLQVAFFFLLFSFTKIEHEHHHGLIVIKLFRCYSTKSSNIVSRFLTIMMLSYLLWLIKRVSFWVCFLPLLCIENCRWIKKGWLLKYYACVKPNWPIFHLSGGNLWLQHRIPTMAQYGRNTGYYQGYQ